MGQGIVKLNRVECFVLDEADRMLDMGFFPDVKRIVKYLPAKRQTLLFSATIPREIAALAESMLRDPEHIAVTPSAKPVDKIEQKVYFVEKSREKDAARPDHPGEQRASDTGLHPHQARPLTAWRAT